MKDDNSDFFFHKIAYISETKTLQMVPFPIHTHNWTSESENDLSPLLAIFILLANSILDTKPHLPYKYYPQLTRIYVLN